MNAKSLCKFTIATLMTSCASAHCVIVDTIGSASKAHGYGMGANLTARRDGSGTAFQKDTTVFAQFSTAAAKGCGKTHMQADRRVCGAPGYDPVLADLNNDIPSSIERMVSQGAVPAAYPGTLMNITFHQVNQDGAGPFRCIIDEAATGLKWNNLIITTQVPGNRGLNNAAMVRNLMTIELPERLDCRGTFGAAKRVCIVRCHNPAPNGPFGGCFPVQQVDLHSAETRN
ncbi:hypothetical protein J3458_015303 [Metarhizium acridum]|uniref:uncharacterized protein n=1 Tax=Metarhizium acridum TaxID=92637 RepID=UPI001C6B8B94|nr:hypothetical protein J3458_015303 [Metarhizium acridum]